MKYSRCLSWFFLKAKSSYGMLEHRWCKHEDLGVSVINRTIVIKTFGQHDHCWKFFQDRNLQEQLSSNTSWKLPLDLTNSCLSCLQLNVAHSQKTLIIVFQCYTIHLHILVAVSDWFSWNTNLNWQVWGKKHIGHETTPDLCSVSVNRICF